MDMYHHPSDYMMYVFNFRNMLMLPYSLSENQSNNIQEHKIQKNVTISTVENANNIESEFSTSDL